MTQDVVYPGECSMCTWEIGVVFCIWIECPEVTNEIHVNRELPDVQAGFRKRRGTRDQIANILWIMEKAREFQKNIYFCFID